MEAIPQLEPESEGETPEPPDKEDPQLLSENDDNPYAANSSENDDNPYDYTPDIESGAD